MGSYFQHDTAMTLSSITVLSVNYLAELPLRLLWLLFYENFQSYELLAFQFLGVVEMC